MQALPPAIMVEILSRLPDAGDLARCRVASKTLNALAADVQALNIVCSFDRYRKSRDPRTKAVVTPFKSVVRRLIFGCRRLNSISVSFENPLREMLENDGEAESDDLYLSSIDFLYQWLPGVAAQLSSLSLSDFWRQSCWRRSEVLGLVSSCCDSLLKLELKNAWLSVEGLKILPKLASLTLEFVRLDDENLTKLNECFPSLQNLNLIGVGGLQEPKILLMQLKTCHWTVSNIPVSVEIHAPNLTELVLLCVRPQKLVIKAPLLSIFDLSIEEPKQFEVDKFMNLKRLRINSSYFHKLMRLFPLCSTVKTLVLDAPKWTDEVREMGSIETLTLVFPNLETLVVGRWPWFEMQKCFAYGSASVIDTGGWMKLKKLSVRMVLSDFDIAYDFLSYVVDELCFISMEDMEVAIRADADDALKGIFFMKCQYENASRIAWKFEEWEEADEEH